MRQVPKNAGGIPRVLPSSLLLFVLAGALLASGPARADLLSKPDPMQGYYVGLGIVGSSSIVYSDKTDWLDPFFGPGGTFHVGQGLTDNLAIGLTVSTSFELNKARSLLVGDFGIELKWRFYADLFVRPAAAFGFADPTRRMTDLVKILPAVAGSYSITFGYDYFIKTRAGGSGGLAVSPLVFVNAKNGTSLTAIQWGIGIEITWWTGLQKDKLALPVTQSFSKE